MGIDFFKGEGGEILPEMGAINLGCVFGRLKAWIARVKRLFDIIGLLKL